MNIKKQLAQRIKQLRYDRGLTAENLAWGGGLSKSNISSAEKGVYLVNMKTILGICKSLKISLAEFFEPFTDIVTDEEDSDDTSLISKS